MQIFVCCTFLDFWSQSDNNNIYPWYPKDTPPSKSVKIWQKIDSQLQKHNIQTPQTFMCLTWMLVEFQTHKNSSYILNLWCVFHSFSTCICYPYARYYPWGFSQQTWVTLAEIELEQLTANFIHLSSEVSHYSVCQSWLRACLSFW